MRYAGHTKKAEALVLSELRKLRQDTEDEKHPSLFREVSFLDDDYTNINRTSADIASLYADCSSTKLIYVRSLNSAAYEALLFAITGAFSPEVGVSYVTCPKHPHDLPSEEAALYPHLINNAEVVYDPFSDDSILKPLYSPEDYVPKVYGWQDWYEYRGAALPPNACRYIIRRLALQVMERDWKYDLLKQAISATDEQYLQFFIALFGSTVEISEKDIEVPELADLIIRYTIDLLALSDKNKATLDLYRKLQLIHDASKIWRSTLSEYGISLDLPVQSGKVCVDEQKVRRLEIALGIDAKIELCKQGVPADDLLV